MLGQSLNIFIFQLSSSKLSLVLAGLLAFKSGIFFCMFVFRFGFGYSPLSRISEIIWALLTKFSLFVIRSCVLRNFNGKGATNNGRTLRLLDRTSPVGKFGENL